MLGPCSNRYLDANIAVEPVEDAHQPVDGEAVVQASGGDQAGPISLGPGACFGEMAILADQPRSATVVAGENGAQTLVLDGGVFREAVFKQPTIGMELLETLSKRLAEKSA